MKPENSNAAPRVSIGVVAMAFITVCAIFSLRNLPNMAEYGWSIVFILSLSCICFFIPSALVSAELASAYPEDGGVFVWVREAFGPRWGFLAIFMEWVQNLPWYPACLTFVASSLAYAFDPDLANNKWFIFIMIQVAMWGATYLNSRGVKYALFITNSGLVFGTIIPCATIFIMTALYLLGGHPTAIPFNGMGDFLPDFSDSMSWMLLAGMMVSLAGMEMSAVHIRRLKNPTVQYPRAILLATVLVILLSCFGAFSIALTVPPEKLSLASGVCQAFEEMMKVLGLQWLTPIFCLLLALGAFAMAATWINGPSNGLLEVSKEGYIPSWWQVRNENGMPKNVFLIQACFASLLSLNILVTPTISNAFWILSALCSQLYMIMYLLMFAAAIRLRYKHADRNSSCRIPGGKIGIWVISGTAFLTSLTAFICGFIPPENILANGFSSCAWYVSYLVVGVSFFIILPMVFFRNYQKRKRTTEQK